MLVMIETENITTTKTRTDSSDFLDVNRQLPASPSLTSKPSIAIAGAAKRKSLMKEKAKMNSAMQMIAPLIMCGGRRAP
jgi:hypothetical protein